MARPGWFLLFLYAPLLFTDTRSLSEPSSLTFQSRLTSKQIQTKQRESYGPGQSPPPPVLNSDQHLRLARGTDEEEQQSTFGQSFENDSVTPPQVTEFVSASGDNNEQQGKGSSPDRGAPGLFNPFYPLVEGSYTAYAVLVLAGVVLALGVVGNMAVMCIVWNNYYMRSAWNYLLASMAFWDFLVLVVCLPVVVLNQLSHRRILGDITCSMVPYMEVGGAIELVATDNCNILAKKKKKKQHHTSCSSAPPAGQNSPNSPPTHPRTGILVSSDMDRYTCYTCYTCYTSSTFSQSEDLQGNISALIIIHDGFSVS